MAADLSIIDRMTPPNTCPMLLACSGIMSSEVSCWLSWTGLTGRIGNGTDVIGRRTQRDAGALIIGGRGVERADEVRAVGIADRWVIEPGEVANRTQYGRHRPFATRRVGEK